MKVAFIIVLVAFGLNECACTPLFRSIQNEQTFSISNVEVPELEKPLARSRRQVEGILSDMIGKKGNLESSRKLQEIVNNRPASRFPAAVRICMKRSRHLKRRISRVKRLAKCFNQLMAMMG